MNLAGKNAFRRTDRDKTGTVIRIDMIVLLLCCMMKIAELSTGRTQQQSRPKSRGKYRRYRRLKGKFR